MTPDPTRSTGGFVRALVAVAASLSLIGGLAVAATAARWYSLRNVGVDAASFVPNQPRRRRHESAIATGPCSERACNYLLLGTDSRAGLSAEEQTHFGDNSDIGGTSRADTIMLVHTDPEPAEGDHPLVPARSLGRHPGPRDEQDQRRRSKAA